MTERRVQVATFVRGLALVSLTAANVSQIAGHHYVGAFVCGSGISWLWYRNARGAALDAAPWLRECYAAGAGCGTVLGMVVMRWLYG